MILVKITNPERVGDTYFTHTGFVSDSTAAFGFRYLENAEIVAGRIRKNLHLDDEVTLVRM